VLDAFHGHGAIWREISKIEPQIDSVVGIEKENGKGRGSIYGDNMKLLPRMDLSGFNVIDLDAYGCPYEQINAVLRNGTLMKGTVVFFTFIRTAKGSVDRRLLEKAGFSTAMIKKIPTIFNKYAEQALESYFAENGIKKYKKIERTSTGSRKMYGVFVVDM